MITKLMKKAVGLTLINSLRYSFGSTVYTQTLNHQNQFEKIPTYRLVDLEGQLLDKSHQYDTALLLKILKAMIYVD